MFINLSTAISRQELYYDVYQSFDGNLEARAVFVGISKAFDKVWDEGLPYKLKQNGISGNLLNPFMTEAAII